MRVVDVVDEAESRLVTLDCVDVEPVTGISVMEVRSEYSLTVVSKTELVAEIIVMSTIVMFAEAPY